MFKPRILPLLLLGMAVLYAVLVPWLQPLDPRAVDLGAVLQGPSAQHPFGTDQLGRDVWIRAAQALRLSLLLALLASAASTVLGVGVGVLAAWRGGWVDRVAMRLVDTTNALPHLLLGVVIVALWRGQWWAIVLSIALTHWTQVARIVRSRLVSERGADYVVLARASGAGARAVWFTHLVPAVAPQAAIALVLHIPHAIWHESSLSFLGVGLPPESASLGLLLEDARGGLLAGAWWLLVFPAALLVLVSWSTAALIDVAGTTGSKGFGVRRPRAQPAPEHLESTPPGKPTNQAPTNRHPTDPDPASTHAPTRQAPADQVPAVQTRGLDLWLATRGGAAAASAVPVQILHQVEYLARPGCINVIVGRSGAGKTLLLRTIAGLLPGGAASSGTLMLGGEIVSGKDLAAARGRRIAYVPGSAGTALNPVRTVASQLRETLKVSGRPATPGDVEAALAELGMGAGLARRHAHELSGGQAQRVLLALGLATGARLLLIDEPTSALDLESVHLIERVLAARAAAGHTIVMVTHDLALARRLALHVAVMEAGRIVEAGTAQSVFDSPAHAFTRSLLGVGA